MTRPTTQAPRSTGPELSDLNGGWQVTPDRVTDFTSAVAKVRADLDTVFQQVDQLTSPSFQPQLGSSPVGAALSAKFLDRLSGDQGLLSSLDVVLGHLDQFVANAELTATQYQETDRSAADGLKGS